MGHGIGIMEHDIIRHVKKVRNSVSWLLFPKFSELGQTRVTNKLTPRVYRLIVTLLLLWLLPIIIERF